MKLLSDKYIHHVRPLFFAAFMLGSCVIWAKQIGVKTDIFFKTYTEDDGLPNATINCFEEDSQGFIWIGTLNGLAKFNGEKFVTFNAGEDINSLQNDEINELHYFDQELWIGTGDGLVVMNTEDESFASYDLPNKDQYSNNVESLVKIGDTLWVGYESNGSLKGALALFSLSKREFVAIKSDEEQLDNIHAIYPDPYDPKTVWIASTDLFKTDMQLSSIQRQTFPIQFSASRRGVTDILNLDQNTLLVSSTRGLYTYEHSQAKWGELIQYNPGESQSVFSPNYVKSMQRQNDSIILINSYDLGLIRFNISQHSFEGFNVSEDDPFAIPSYRNHKSFIDSKSRIWNGFYTGMNVILEESQIVSLAAFDLSGHTSIPIHTKRGLECMIDGKHILLSKNALEPLRINSPFKENWLYAEESQNGDKYYLFKDALYKLNQGSKYYQKVVRKSIFQSGEENRRFFKFFSIDRSQRVWITTELGNIVLYDPAEGAELIPIKDNRIGICETAPEASYRIAHGDTETIISHACGLLFYDENQNMLIDIDDHFEQPVWNSNRWTYSIAYTGNDKYVIGTFRQGLYELDMSDLNVSNINPQLENIIISNITSHGNGEAWCATDGGIIYYNSLRNYSTLITEKEGLPEEYLIFQKLYYDEHRKVKMLTSGNLIEIDGSKLINRGNSSKPLITAISVDNEDLFKNMYLSQDTIIELAYDRNNIEISYSHNTNFSNNPAAYFYKMDGLNDDWVDVKNNSTARFFELKPGKYTFNLSRSIGSPDENNSVGISINIKAPFWKTWWFRLVSLLLALALIYWLYKNRIASVKNRMRLEQEESQNTILKKQNDIIQNQNKELVKLNQSKDKFFSVLAHDLRAPLSAFSGLGKQLNYHIERKNLKKVSLLSGHIQESAENLTTLVDNLLNWSLVQTGKIAYEPEDLSIGEIIATIKGQLKDVVHDKNITITTNISPHAIVYADSQAVHIILRNLISNAIKFSYEDSTILINTEIGDKVLVTIKDQGVGISSERLDMIVADGGLSSLGTMGEQGLGLGIELCKELLEMNHATFDIESEENKGTSVTIQFPKST